MYGTHKHSVPMAGWRCSVQGVSPKASRRSMTVVNTRLLDFWVALLRGKGMNVRTLWIAVLSFLPAVAGAQMLGASLISTSADGLIYTSGISVTTNQASVTSLYASGKVGIGTATTTNGKLEVQTTSGKAIYAASTANSYTIWVLIAIAAAWVSMASTRIQVALAL